ncbi:FIGNL1-interacting regulator of recombination and mitosis-like [Glandiceps talaboti]
MSQSSYLEDICSWDISTCKQHLSDALPKLISSFSSSNISPEKQLVILKTLTSSFLPCLEICDVEINLYSQILPQTSELFDNTLVAITTALQEHQDGRLQDTLLQCLKVILDIVDCLCQCIQHVCSNGSHSVNLKQVQSLPTTVIHVVKGSYNHCKESTSLYGNTFHLVSEPLGQLFKKSFELEKLLLTLLQAVIVSSTEDDVTTVTQVCNGLYDICTVISDVDDTVLLRTWKSLVEISTKNKMILRDRLKVSDMIRVLCQEIQSTYEYLLQLAGDTEISGSQGTNDKIFGRKFKVCRFFVNILMTLVKEFDGYLGPCYEDLYKLILALLSMSPPSLYSTPVNSARMKDMKQSLLVFIEPLVSMLIPTQQFVEVLTKSNQGLPPEWYFPHCMLLIQVVKELSSQRGDVIDLWMKPTNLPEDDHRDDIIKTVFTSVKKCYIELSLPVQVPGLMCDGRPYREVSLYQHICVHLCTMVASLPSTYFSIVENNLLEHVLSIDLYPALLAMDVWCFIARSGSPSLVSHYVDLLVGLLSTLPYNTNTLYANITTLNKRLVSLMDQHYQNEFIEKYPPDKYSHIWTHLPLSAFPYPVLQQVICEQVTRYSVESIQTWIESPTQTKSALVKLRTYLRLLCNIYQDSIPTSLPLSSQLQTSTIEVICKLWTVLPIDKISSNHAIYCLIVLSSWVLPLLQSAELSQIITCLLRGLSTSPSVVFRLAVTDFLRNFRKKIVPQPHEQDEILNKLPHLFSEVLSDSNAMIHQKALEAFSIFAEETVYEQIVPECLQKGNIQDIAVDFLSKIPFTGGMELPSDVDQLRNQHGAITQYLQSQCQQMSAVHLNQKIKTDITTSDDTSINSEPYSKRTKYDESEYSDAVHQIQQQLNKMEELQKTIPTPSWLSQELTKIQDRLNKLSNS